MECDIRIVIATLMLFENNNITPKLQTTTKDRYVDGSFNFMQIK